MAKTFTSFKAVEADWRIRISPNRIKKKALRNVGLYMRKWIQAQHGSSSLKPNTAFTKAMKGGGRPLIDQGKLRKAVSFRATHNAVIIYSKEPFLQSIHEYGRRWKMSDKQRRFIMAMLNEVGMGGKRRGRPRTTSKGMIVIPPRPIWRRALPENVSMIRHIIQSVINQSIQ